MQPLDFRSTPTLEQYKEYYNSLPYQKRFSKINKPKHQLALNLIVGVLCLLLSIALALLKPSPIISYFVIPVLVFYFTVIILFFAMPNRQANLSFQNSMHNQQVTRLDERGISYWQLSGEVSTFISWQNISHTIQTTNLVVLISKFGLAFIFSRAEIATMQGQFEAMLSTYIPHLPTSIVEF